VSVKPGQTKVAQGTSEFQMIAAHLQSS